MTKVYIDSVEAGLGVKWKVGLGMICGGNICADVYVMIVVRMGLGLHEGLDGYSIKCFRTIFVSLKMMGFAFTRFYSMFRIVCLIFLIVLSILAID